MLCNDNLELFYFFHSHLHGILDLSPTPITSLLLLDKKFKELGKTKQGVF